MAKEVKILADYREFQSGIPTLLLNKQIEITLKNLEAGDYLINDQILVERKTKEDFVLSLMNNRLFNQCLKLKRSLKYPLLIIEGNPYNTNHKINRQAVKGALLSVSVAWQIPVFFSKNVEETAELLIMAGKQMLQEKMLILRKGYKPKKQKNHQLYFLQGLPAVGPSLAYRLLLHFGSIEKIIKATEKQLLTVNGIGKGKARKIVDFIEMKF